MESDRSQTEKRNRRMNFSPKGSVAKDPRFARALELCYLSELFSVAAYAYRSLIADRIDPELSGRLDTLAGDAAGRFRILGDLILALGGNPVIHTQLSVDPIEPPGERRRDPSLPEMLCECVSEEKRKIDRYQTMLGRTDDRVVRSILMQLLSEVDRTRSILNSITEKYC